MTATGAAALRAAREVVRKLWDGIDARLFDRITASWTRLRFDPTLIPITLGTMAAVRAISNGAQRPFPGALMGAVAAAGLVLALSWWWFRLLRRNS